VNNAKGTLVAKPTIQTLFSYVGKFVFIYKLIYNYVIPRETIDDIKDVRSPHRDIQAVLIFAVY